MPVQWVKPDAGLVVSDALGLPLRADKRKGACMIRPVAVGVVVCLTMAVSAHAATSWITRDDYDDISIVVADNASPSERYGAEQFKAYWQRCTGYDAPLGATPTSRVTVWIGREAVPPPLLKSADLGGLGTDGLHLKTVGGNLLIIGGRERGAMYGVFEFFERYMGVRWFAPDCTYVPAPPDALPRIDFRYVPPFRWRDISYRAFCNAWFAAAHHLNGQHAALPPEMGGSISFANGFGHTFHSFVSPDEYGQTHPEYFSEVEGKRRTERSSTQLCLTNPDVLRIVIDKTRSILRNSPPDRPIVSVTQMDTGFWCECARCAAIDEREGSHAGSVIWFVNQVAEAIEDEFPHAFIDTFAYTYSRKPPKHIRPRDNVIVRLCSIECDFSRPHDDHSSAYNRAFHADLDRWSKIAKNLYVWDYTQNWYCHQQPHPNFQVLQPNIRFFAEHGVKGLFEQASPTSPHSDFEYLKGYILARAMWNPNVDWRELMDEFIKVYYQGAGSCIHEYIDLITKKVRQDNYYLAFNSKLEWMDYDTVVKADAIFQRAFAAAQDPVIRERLESVYLSVQYAALVCKPKIVLEGHAWVLTRPPSLTFDEYWSRIKNMGVTMLEDVPIEKLRERLDGQTPPRCQKVSIEKLENASYEVWIVPEMCGAVVRFMHKGSGVDLFRGSESILNERWRWQDWEVMDPKAPRIEEGITGVYRVVERANERITMEHDLSNGITIRRSLALDAASPSLKVAFTVVNRGTTEIVPLVKPHPEFWLQGRHEPEIWLERRDGWKREPLKYVGQSQAGADAIDPAGISRWAAWIPRKRIAVIATVPAENVGSLFYYFNIPNEQVNLEFVPDLSPLEPGASRTMTAEYSIARQKPCRS